MTEESAAPALKPPPTYNTYAPPTLEVRGILSGGGIGVEPTSFQPLDNRGRVWVGTLWEPLTPELARGGEMDKVVIKSEDATSNNLPRSILKEAKILADLFHPNIVCLLNAYLEPSPHTWDAPKYMLFFPYYTTSLRYLLRSPLLVPPSETSNDKTKFPIVVNSLTYQMVSALDYLHLNQIAHRDISPNNFVLSRTGLIVLIDFELAIHEGVENPNAQEVAIGTGPYRPPEILFGSRDYDGYAVDRWALGATIAEFFRGFTVMVDQDDGSDDQSETISQPVLETRQDRIPLFEAHTRSEIALLGSIFRVLGTPTLETWPEAANYPLFSQFTFDNFPPQNLEALLPSLAPGSPLLQLLEGLLRISASERMDLTDAMALIEPLPMNLPAEITEEPTPRAEDTVDSLTNLIDSFL